MSNDDLSRRDALTSGAAAALVGVGAALAVSAVTRDAHAQNAADATALNGLLRAEYEAIRAYDTAIGYLMSPPMTDPGASLGPAAAAVANRFRAQHRDHATALIPLVTAAGGTPVNESTVLFTPPAGLSLSVSNLIRLAANKEKAAAIAYTNALRTLSTQGAAEVVAAIGGVETQHFIVLYLLAKGIAQPGMNAATMTNAIVPSSFVSIEANPAASLDSVADLAFTA